MHSLDDLKLAAHVVLHPLIQFIDGLARTHKNSVVLVVGLERIAGSIIAGASDEHAEGSLESIALVLELAYERFGGSVLKSLNFGHDLLKVKVLTLKSGKGNGTSLTRGSTFASIGQLTSEEFVEIADKIRSLCGMTFENDGTRLVNEHDVRNAVDTVLGGSIRLSSPKMLD